MKLPFNGKWIKPAAIAAGVLSTVFSTVSHTARDQFSIRETAYKFSSEIREPGITLQIPFFQFTHNYMANTQKINFNAGSCRFLPMCKSTLDQNALTADISLNYRVLPNAEKLSFHLWEMDGFITKDGYWLLTRMLNDSTNAVMGKSTMTQLLAAPEKFLKDVKEDFAFRIKQNNIPIEIESLEMKEFSTSIWPVHSVQYAVVKGP